MSQRRTGAGFCPVPAVFRKGRIALYQALYRKWRPKTFDDVVGQSHITDTLKYQVATDHLSHAYLFTGTRGTGKTSCAKILARAVNCEHPVDGNPCNQCAACRGIEDGSILDVLELDAASNNGVDHVRALRDEAIYTPAAVKKRVYIIDEVHMLSTSAFNALLKILEEPSPHLMFILATTELHKVLPTVLSRCQRFSFKRIRPEDIAARLEYVAGQERIDLTPEGAALLARLADGGLRDALSLLDQCAAGGGAVDREKVLDILGLAGNLRTAHLFNYLRRGDAGGAIKELGALYDAGKDVSAVLAELSDLSRDLLIRATVPEGGKGLLAGGYDEQTLQTLGKNMPPERLLSMLNLLEQARQEVKSSGRGRTLAELCLIRLSDPSLDGSTQGLAARIARLEAQMAQGGIPQAVEAELPMPEAEPAGTPPREVPAPEVKRATTKSAAPAAAQTADQSAPQGSAAGADWPALLDKMKGVVSPMALPFLRQEGVSAAWDGKVLTVQVGDDFAYDQLHQPQVEAAIAQVASAHYGCAATVQLRRGEAPKAQPVSAPAPRQGSMGDLKAFLKNHRE